MDETKGEKMKRISIIVPIYGVENYLNECIQSIVKQTISDIEILLVDDGSPDRCGEICEEWAARDERIIAIHKENGGVSSARNSALKKASGEFIAFVDSDDWLAPDYVEKLLNALQNNNADIAMCSSWSVGKDNSRPASHLPEKAEIIDASKYSERFLTWLGAYSVVWNKMFKRELFDQVCFRENVLFEDMIFMGDILQRVQKIAYIPEQLYFYRMRKSSIINKDRMKLSKYMQVATQHLVKLYQNDSKLAYLAEKLSYNQLLNYYIDAPKADCRAWKKQLAISRKRLWMNTYSGFKFKAKLGLTAVCPIIYCRWKEKKKKVAYTYFE